MASRSRGKRNDRQSQEGVDEKGKEVGEIKTLELYQNRKKALFIM
ncbi:MAG: hypothetical protein V8S14_06625 [Lachnospiraceae bacterium]